MSEEFKTSKARAERCVTHHHACDCREYKFQELEAELAVLRELLYDAYELGQTDAAGNGTLAGVAYKDKKQVTAALLQESSDE